MRVRRLFGLLGLVAVAQMGLATSAWAHSDFEPKSAQAGGEAKLTLRVKNELPDVGTTKIRLVFPESLAVSALPAVDGWVAKLEGTSHPDDEATGITWTRPSARPAAETRLPLTLGPLPLDPERLRFSVVQTYSNGHVDRWTQDWAKGGPEPRRAAPVLNVTPENFNLPTYAETATYVVLGLLVVGTAYIVMPPRRRGPKTDARPGTAATA